MLGNRIATAHVTVTKTTVTIRLLHNTLLLWVYLRLLREVLLVEDQVEELVAARVVVRRERSA